MERNKNHAKNIGLDEYMVMANHVHGILTANRNIACLMAPCEEDEGNFCRGLITIRAFLVRSSQNADLKISKLQERLSLKKITFYTWTDLEI